MSDARDLLSEIARLKAELADANEALACAYMLGAENAKDEIARLNRVIATQVCGAQFESDRATVAINELAGATAEIARLKSELAIAETATRKALEAVPIAMTAARNKEREACAQTVEDERVDDDETGQLDDCAYNLALDHAAAAIRARASEATNG